MVLNITTADRRCTPRYYLFLLVVFIVLEVNELKGPTLSGFQLAVEAKPLIALLQLVSHQRQQQQQQQQPSTQSRYELTERQEQIGNYRQQLLLLSRHQEQQQNAKQELSSQEQDEIEHDLEGWSNNFSPLASLIPHQQQQRRAISQPPSQTAGFAVQKRGFDFGRHGTRSRDLTAVAKASLPTYFSNKNDTTSETALTKTEATTKETSEETQQTTGAATAGESDDSMLRKALLGLQNPRLLGGDIIMTIGGRRKDRLIKFERSALVSSVSLWPSGVIFYELDSSVSHLTNLIYKVMQQFHDETCIKFIARKHNEPDYLRIEALKGCFSYIGRIGGEQTLSLGDGCEYRGTIAHELLHAVGFYHHQNRSDRDDFLEILWDNIARGKESQFLKMNPQDNILLNEFDYDSIMLYGPRTFGKNLDKVTMKPKREGVILLEVVEKQGLSLLDIDSVNKLYKCKTFDR